MRNGDSPDSPLLWRGCGNSGIPETIRTMSNKMWIEFHSESNAGAHRGFSFGTRMLTDGCGGMLHGSSGNISSPIQAASAKYPNGVECKWTMEASSGYHISITFYGRFEIEDSVNCTNDYLLVSDSKRCQLQRLHGRFYTSLTMPRIARDVNLQLVLIGL